MDELTLAIMGIDHANTDKAKSSRRFELLLCVPGEPVHLVPEPRNPHDSNAVAVFSDRGIQLGYLSAERAPFVGSRIRAGVDVAAIFQGLTKHMAWVRVRFGGRHVDATASRDACRYSVGLRR